MAIKYFAAAAALLLAMGASHAEKADSYKKTEIEYDTADLDDVKQIQTLRGNVVLTRGTLKMKSAMAVVTQDAEGYQYVTLTGAPGKPATFRQKRDGAGDQWVEGEAERIDYDGHIELVKLFSKAKIRRLEGSRPSDEVAGEFISYDSRKEYFSVRNTVTGDSKPGAGRGTMVIQPSSKRVPPEGAVQPEAGK
ncbi:lipopolysaccharide transport periplasmic protein LptA [Pseudoduganella ginsengisoli]|uniref:Lipopolysaccharide export system protein LptA n=1 Tax=Pseudoduganella ginsengisoli TaxID=1462440 RepID=A0A6L6Q3Z5_9BURK|nr:lipopolysaccharide transport periplasmic protein LptA [Pseudoduganella ginsengisoli]MTW03772.1 lipopolysaccharide transport periplasmic protein LptA [Pseudoduganella ginsengisoli]